MHCSFFNVLQGIMKANVGEEPLAFKKEKRSGAECFTSDRVELSFRSMLTDKALTVNPIYAQF